ncbi:MAG: hypothetical protein K0R26_1979 [Bacteroidota bacterium]|jgi:hypothetical protein|nr:hypothetical protein [Bacteroidota bacterium]
MILLSIVFFTVLILSSLIILYQDFKERQVSLWVLLIFGAVAISSVLFFRDKETLFYNGLGIILYGGFIWLVLKLYLFIKFKKNKTILDEQLGLADVLVIFFIGLTFNTVGMVFFFCFGFVFSLLIFLVYSFLKKDNDRQSIPLAGLLVFFYVISLIILNLIPLNPLIDCSFIMI